MQTYTECIPCFIRQAHDALQLVAADDEALIRRTLQKVLLEAAKFPATETPPAMAQTTHRIIREATGISDPYAEIKAESTRLALDLALKARTVIDAADDPFAVAVRFSIAGNILDFALAAAWDRLDLTHFIEKTQNQLLDSGSLEALRKATTAARNILFLGDNAGETVFDKLLIEQLGHAQVRYAVKSAPIINDATLADARAAGLDTVAELVENGSDAPGTILPDCSAEFRRLFDAAELVIAKGQANYESLSQVDRPIFFLTQVKCPVIGRDLGAPVGDWIIREHKGVTS